MGCATQGEKAAIIKELQEKELKLKYLLRAIGMSRSTYYFELKKSDVVSERNSQLTEKIKEIFYDNKQRYWSPSGMPGIT